MKMIEADSCERAWLEATTHILSCPDQEEYNLVVEIARPTVRAEYDRVVYDTVDEFLRAHEGQPIVTVAETIFPAGEYRRHGRKGVYQIYPEDIYPKIKGTGWGRYAYRLVRRRTADRKEDFNPLEDVVAKLRTQLKQRGPKRACYELSPYDSSLDLPLYDPEKDSGRPLGGPCLSHISLKLHQEGKLYLTALYRAHYYIARALGNFKGLASLQAFICEETGLTPGPLLCVSTFAKIDTDFCNMTEVRDLITRLKASEPDTKSVKIEPGRKKA